MHKRGFTAAALAWGVVGSPVPAGAYDLKPMVIQIRPSGSGSSATAVITNTHPVPVAIEIRAFRREQQPDGTDKLIPEERDIIMSPPQMVIAPKASQSFRIQWVGEARPERELAYRIVTEQLPIQFSKVTRNDRTADLTMRYRYEMALYVEPEGTKPSARIVSAETVSGKDGAREVALRIRSDGGMRAILDKPVLQLSPASGGASVRIEGDALKQLVGMNILPGNERLIRIPAPPGLADGKLTGTLASEYVVLR